MPRHLWILDHLAFSNGWLYSTQRLYALARALKPHDWQTTLIAGRKFGESRNLSVEENFPGAFVRTPFPSGAWPTCVDRRFFRTAWLGCMRAIGLEPFLENPEVEWGPRVSRWARSLAARQIEPDAVWGVSYGTLRSPVAARRISEVFEVPLVVELQDPCPRPGYSLTPNEEAAFARTLGHAASIVVTTSAYAEFLRAHYPQFSNKVQVVYLTTPPAPPESSRISGQMPAGDSPRLIILHAGYLYGGLGRNARSLVSSLPLLHRWRPDSRGNVVIRLVGGGPGSLEAVELAARLSVRDSVSIEGQVPPDRIWEEMNRADCLVLIKFGGTEFDMQIPGKLFHYLGIGKPILGLVPSGETEAILRKSGVGLVAEPENVEAIARHLVELWDRKGTAVATGTMDLDYVRRFSEELMGIQVRDILTDSLGKLSVVERPDQGTRIPHRRF